MGWQKKLTIDAVEYCVTNADIADSVDSKDVSCSGANGQYRRRAAGLAGVALTITINLDLTENPWTDPPALTPGTYLTEVKYFPDRSDATQFWHLPSAYIPTNGVSASMEDPHVLTVVLESDGIYYRPVG
jgi:hypothetical protein